MKVTYALPNPNLRPWLGLIAWLAVCFAAAGTASLVTVEGWYASLRKPIWNPPTWVFAPVWSLLYALMAVAAWQVWLEGGWRRRRGPLTLFSAQLLLNALWTPLFFRLHETGLALAEIALLWVCLVATVVAFAGVRRSAGWLLAPYLAWISYAAALNGALWRLNP